MRRYANLQRRLNRLAQMRRPPDHTAEARWWLALATMPMNDDDRAELELAAASALRGAPMDRSLIPAGMVQDGAP